VSWLAPLGGISRRAHRLLHALVPWRHAQRPAEVIDGTDQAVALSIGSSPAVQTSPSRITPAVAEACQQRRQGDIVRLPSLPVLEPGGSVRQHPTPEGVVLLSQTCDIVLPDRLTIAAAPLVRLSGDTLQQATRGKRPRYVAVPAVGADAFADLDVIGTLDKDILLNTPATTGIGPADVAVRNFGRRIARRFGRFPFPDDVVPWFAPLADVITGKYGKLTGEALALEQVVELRVEATGGWTTPPYALTLVTIVRAGTLPEIEEDDQIDPPTSLRSWLRTPDGRLRRASGEIANRLFAHQLDSTGRSPAPTPPERYHLWLALAEAWAARCTPRERDKAERAIAEAVADGVVAADIASEDEYSLARYRRSEQLDVEHLSPPTPA
jgi:hypothetical protein